MSKECIHFFGPFCIYYNSIQVHSNLQLYKLRFRSEKLQIPPTTTPNVSLLFTFQNLRIVQRIIIKLVIGLLYKTCCWTRMFIGPCIIVIVEELKTNLMSLVIFISLIICSTCFEH